MMPTPELIVRLPNWVGDVMMCLPALKLLAQHGIKLHLFGKPWIHDLLKDMPYECHTFKDRLSLKKIPCDNLILFTNSFSSALKGRLAGKKTLGYRTDGRRLLLNHAPDKSHHVHETEVFFYLAQQALLYFFNIDSKPLKIDALKPELIIHTKPLLNSPYMVLCPFAHGRTRDNQIKKWPKWQALADKLAYLHPVICPGPNEEAEAAHYFPKLQTLPNLSLHEYANVLAHASLVIANDSGPMHIAAALNTPTIGLFGVTNPKRTGPKTAIILGDSTDWPSLETVLAQAQPYLERISSN